MDAKCTDSQWFGGPGGAGPGSSVNFHHVSEQQQQQSCADDDDDELASILLPDLHGKSDILEQMHVKELSKCLPARAEGYAWTLAFTTTTMGFSLKSLYRSLSRYEGPVLLVIRDNEQSIFGAFSSCNLKPSESFYGTGETYLFTFKQPKQPKQSTQSTITASSATTGSTSGGSIGSSAQQKPHHFKRFPWTGDNLYFIKGDSDSLAFGAGEGNFGLWLDEDLYHGSTHACKTFNNEPLAHHEDFVVCTLECWCFL